jgi:hypothetical protein
MGQIPPQLRTKEGRTEEFHAAVMEKAQRLLGGFNGPKTTKKIPRRWRHQGMDIERSRSSGQIATVGGATLELVELRRTYLTPSRFPLLGGLGKAGLRIGLQRHEESLGMTIIRDGSSVEVPEALHPLDEEFAPRLTVTIGNQRDSSGNTKPLGMEALSGFYAQLQAFEAAMKPVE